MTTTQHTVVVSDLAAIVADPQRGIFSLVGNFGGLALITGSIEDSHVFGGIAIETEHGTVYLDPESEVVVSEVLPNDENHEWLVQWSIDAYGPTPEAAAADVWVKTFGRTVADQDDACSFTVTDSITKEVHQVDLSEHDLDALIG